MPRLAIGPLDMYYEIHGDGAPLVLLHGGLGSIEMFGPLLPALAARRRVIAVELQAHAHTADIDRPLRFELMADDVAALIRALALGKVDVVGYSLGAGVALRLAIQHPDVVRTLTPISAPIKRQGWYPEVLEGMARMTRATMEAMTAAPIYKHYAAVAPRPEDWGTLGEKTVELLKRDYDWTAEVAKIAAPVMFVVADADSLRPAHVVEMFALFGGGQRDAGWDGSGRPRGRLAVVPGTTHYDITASPGLGDTILRFVNADQ